MAVRHGGCYTARIHHYAGVPRRQEAAQMSTTVPQNLGRILAPDEEHEDTPARALRLRMQKHLAAGYPPEEAWDLAVYDCGPRLADMRRAAKGETSPLDWLGARMIRAAHGLPASIPES